jgi:hypothetical protein
MASEYSITITKAPKVSAETQDEKDRNYTLPYFDDKLDSRHILNLFVDEEDLEPDLLGHLSVDEDIEEEGQESTIGTSFRQWRNFLDGVYDAIGDDKYQDIEDFIDNYLEHVKLQRGSKEPVTFLYDFKTNTTSYTDAQYFYIDSDLQTDNWWCQPYVLLKIYYGVYKLYEKEEEELRYQLEIKEEDKVKNLVSLVTRTTHQTPIMGDTLAVIDWEDREQAAKTTPMERHYSSQVIEQEHHEGNFYAALPRWKSNHARKNKNAILTARKKITAINEKVPIMEAIVNESNDEVIDHSPEDVAEAKHFLSRYRTRLRLNEQVLTASQVGIPPRTDPPVQIAWDWENDPRLKEEVRLIREAAEKEEREAAERLIREADEKKSRDKHITENKGEILKEWSTLYKTKLGENKKTWKDKGLDTETVKKLGSRLTQFLDSLVRDDGEIWKMERPLSLKNYLRTKLDEWTKRQSELQQQQSEPPTSTVSGGSMMMATPGGTQEEKPKHSSPSRKELRAKVKRARSQTTPPTGAKRVRINRASRTGKRGIEEVVVLGGFRDGEGRSSPKKRPRIGKLPGGWERKTNRLNSQLDGIGSLIGLNRSKSLN